MKLGKVVSGGQTGVDQAALRAARSAGIETGGAAPRGWLTEIGPAPWLADYGLRQSFSASYIVRTARNVQSAGATLILADSLADVTGGTKATERFAARSGKPWLTLFLAYQTAALVAAGDFFGALARGPWAPWTGPRTLNVAGPRESKCPGIGGRAEAFLAALFAQLEALP